MNLIPWRNKKQGDDVFDMAPMSGFRSEMDRLFDRMLRVPWAGFDGLSDSMGDWNPSLEVTETGNEVVVRAEVPGVSANDLDVSVSGNMLTLSGEKKESTEDKREGYHRTERRFGSFRRSVQLPFSVESEKVSAEHKDGVLTIRLSKCEDAQSKRIKVKQLK